MPRPNKHLANFIEALKFIQPNAQIKIITKNKILINNKYIVKYDGYTWDLFDAKTNKLIGWSNDSLEILYYILKCRKKT